MTLQLLLRDVEVIEFDLSYVSFDEVLVHSMEVGVSDGH